MSDPAARGLIEAMGEVFRYDRDHPASGGLRTRLDAAFNAWNRAILEQEAAALDVERLARAIAVCLGSTDTTAWRDDPDMETEDLPVIPHDLNDREEWYASPNEMAHAIAREYAKLTEDEG